MAEKSRVLVIDGTGYIGKFIVEASVKLGHPTFAMVRESSASDPAKAILLDGIKNSGVFLLHGDLYDHESLVKAIKQVDVVISAIKQLADQTRIIAAIKEAGNVKRFFPSEFVRDADRSTAVEPAKSILTAKAKIRRAIEAEGIPHTYVVCNCFASFFLTTLSQPGLMAPPPPKDKLIIMGEGNVRVAFNKEEDIATFTIKAVDDPRTLNKILYIAPPRNTYSFNDLVSLWEKKIGKTVKRIYVPEHKILKDIQESPAPINLTLAIYFSVFVMGEETNSEIDESYGVEASQLYPNVNYTTVDEYLDQFV
ncbi:hypothetical protein Nepgr_025232 [Nepenthes gracilis]|uniref:NmrA-like domain-containing protein n=1 Tax=Nepenthes gracilis TaxID=150966 RepID=A0AAD3T6I5_NEPGR|nr:hypothetical protein Nepgr_025232 [Nepenthes gracilis]